MVRNTALVLAALGAAATLSLAATPAHAQEAADGDARMHFRLGRAYYDSGRFEEAAGEFQLAYDQSQRPALLYNVFVSHRDAGNVGEAIIALREYLRLSPDIDNREQLTARLASMEQLAERQGSSETSSEAGGTQTAETSSAQASSSTEASASSTESTESSATGPEPSASSGGGGGGGPWIPGFIIAAVGGVALITGAVLGGLALSSRDSLEAEFNCDAEGRCDPGFDGAAAEGATLAGAADGLLWGGLAIAATGVILAFVLADSGEDVAAGAMCGPDGCVATVGGRY